jgi:hypothetical protein
MLSPVIPEADAVAEAIRDQVPDILDCVSDCGMTGERRMRGASGMMGV